MRRLLTVVTGLLTALALMAPTTGAWAQNEALGSVIRGGTINLKVGESQPVKNVTTFEIADSSIATAKASSDGSVIITGISGGTTTLLVRKQGVMGMFSYDVQVSGRDVEVIQKTVDAALGGIIGLLISREGDVIVLEGKISDRDDGKRIDRQITRNGEAILDLTARSYMAQDLDRLKKQLRESGYPNIDAQVEMGDEGKDVLILRGIVFSDKQKDNVLLMSGKFFSDERTVEHIEVDRPQVEVDVEALAFDLSKTRQIGSNNLLKQISTFSSTGWTFQTGPGGATTYPNLSVGAFTVDLRAIHDVGGVTNIMKQHASVRSGETARIENVTDHKIKVESAFDSKLESVKVGQILEVTPTVQENGSFETLVKVEVSELAGAASTVEDAALAVKSKNISTTFISNKDEKVVLGGSLGTMTKEVINKTPILGSIPIINIFFKRKDNEVVETTNVFFMTLRAPTVEAATGDSMGSGAKDAEAMIKDKSGEQETFINKKVKQK